MEGYTIFLDRDGTLNPDPGYIKSPDQFELFPGVAEALARLKLAGARLILITNQSGIARGLLSRHNLEAIHKKLRHLLSQAGATLDGIYFCPHHPDDGCRCRKPNRGMIDQAVQERGVDLGRSYVIGDHLRDIGLAKRVGARSVLVTTGVTRWQELEGLTDTHLIPDRVEASLTKAVDWLLSDVNRGALSRPE
ncbi:MAG TPA: D-glycero-beta-D-manno-heptose-1,7-bisphosphate 7-phosphatase [Nitrospira sp.]|nr:D-glycero-beta-D-manno-heptose-1,7-bisphosphate 7-phosphatase [Nitrospira sp.]